MSPQPRLVVIHPLDDEPEIKRTPAAAGRMRMSRTVRWALFALRAYLVVIVALVVYRVYVLAR
ncbi:MAG TPA: hypothetical protein VNW46_16490 [Gemmatimonadaceae bacterium]|jgi:hypothetical protein|nr:hypothetical protein [Gemmatimonadaceae bacterium]